MSKISKNMLIDINFYQYFTDILWINLHTNFILPNFGLKLGQCVPLAKNINIYLTYC